jgi:hypothetical protein
MSNQLNVLTELAVELLPIIGGGVIFLILLALACYGFQMIRLFFKF